MTGRPGRTATPDPAQDGQGDAAGDQHPPDRQKRRRLDAVVVAPAAPERGDELLEASRRRRQVGQRGNVDRERLRTELADDRLKEELDRLLA